MRGRRVSSLAKANGRRCHRGDATTMTKEGGVEPDVLIGFRDHDALLQRTERLARAMPQALARLGMP